MTVRNGTKEAFTRVSGTVYTLVVTPPPASSGNIIIDTSTSGVTNSIGIEVTRPCHYVQPFNTITGSGGTRPLAITALNADQTEGNSGSKAFTFTVSRTGDTAGVSSAAWTVTGSGANSANTVDFSGSVFPSGTVNFAVGEISQTITVNINGDTTIESDEGFTVTLSNPIGATIATSTASGIIRNDDVASPTLAITALNADQTEGNSGSKAFTFTVSRTGDTAGVSSAAWTVTGSGANSANTVDFSGSVFPSGTVNFAVGEISQTITVNINGDTTIESDEGFTVTLSNPIGATIATSTASGIIRNDDVAGTSVAFGFLVAPSVSFGSGAGGAFSRSEVMVADGPYVLGYHFTTDFDRKLVRLGIYKPTQADTTATPRSNQPSSMDHSVGIWDFTDPENPVLIWQQDFLATAACVADTTATVAPYYCWFDINDGPELNAYVDYVVAATWDELTPVSVLPENVTILIDGFKLNTSAATEQGAVPGMLIDLSSESYYAPTGSSFMLEKGFLTVNMILTDL